MIIMNYTGLSSEKWTSLNEDEKSHYIIVFVKYGVLAQHLNQLWQELG